LVLVLLSGAASAAAAVQADTAVSQLLYTSRLLQEGTQKAVEYQALLLSAQPEDWCSLSGVHTAADLRLLAPAAACERAAAVWLKQLLPCLVLG
jgi:hypothetical protein